MRADGGPISFFDFLETMKGDLLKSFHEEMEIEYRQFLREILPEATFEMKTDHIEEVWVTIDLLPNYEVSNYGRVCSVKTGKELTPTPDGKGLLKVALYHGGVRRDVYVHRMVAKAFFLNYQEGHEVKHVSENLQDNTVLNLTLSQRPCRKSEEPLW